MIYDVIKDALMHELGIDEEVITPDAYIDKDLELDSTETVVIALTLKKKYHIDYVFPSNDVQIKDIVEFVEKNTSVTN